MVLKTLTFMKNKKKKVPNQTLLFSLLIAFRTEALNRLSSFNPDSHLASCFLRQVKSHDQVHILFRIVSKLSFREEVSLE